MLALFATANGKIANELVPLRMMLKNWSDEDLGAAEASTLAVTWKDCGSSSSIAHVTALSPSTITMGTTNTVTGTGTGSKEVTGGDFTLKMKAGFITQNYSGKVCQPSTFTLPMNLGTLSWPGMNCPQAAGEVTVQMGVEMSNNIPSFMRSSTLTLKATDQDKAELLCMEVKTKN
jgi:hypothetical protein